MNHIYACMPFLLIPIIGITLAARCIWTAAMSFLAGMGLANAKDTHYTKTLPEDEMVLCYERVEPPSSLIGTPWANITEMENWANAEHRILYLVKSNNVNHDAVQDWVEQAENAALAAKSVVNRRELSADTYQMALKVLQEWHADIITSKTLVSCYDRAGSLPYIEDVSQQLMHLEQLMEDGKLDSKALEEIQEGIRKRLSKDINPETSKELSLLLVNLIYN